MKNVLFTSAFQESELMMRNADHELQELVKILVNRYKPDKVICFARILTNLRRDSCFATPIQDPYCHYFILMVTSESFPDSEIQDYVNTHFDAAGATILSHHYSRIQEALTKGNYFFSTVWRSGLLIYSADGNMQLPQAAGSAAFDLEKAERLYSHRIGLARGFVESAHGRYYTGQYSICTFLLHQAMEQSCQAMIRVFLAYRSEIHKLGRLLDLCACFTDEPAEIFPRSNEQERHLFQLLSKSYTDARYKEEFEVSEEVSYQLLCRMEKFIGLADRLCSNRITELKINSSYCEQVLD